MVEDTRLSAPFFSTLTIESRIFCGSISMADAHFTISESPLKVSVIENAVTPKTKFAAVTHISNVIGRVNPVEKIIEKVHGVGGVVLVDAAQSAPHIPIDVQKMDADFLAFSGHKLMAPMGIGTCNTVRYMG